jgi:fructokinase
MDLYHIKTVILTMGDQASHWFHHHHHHEKPILKIQHVVDTVGAGDAYAAICAAGITNRLPVEKTTALAVQFASHICQSRGALPDDLSIYQPLAKKLGMK